MARTETVTVVFTDLVGSSELAGLVGHDAYEAFRHSHFEALRSAVAKHNGREIKTTGDGLMLCFASAADAVACTIAMQQAADAHARRNHEQLTIRVGASSGEATREDDDFYGPPVVEAARLCAAASPGQILVSDVVRTLARGRGHQFTSVGELKLKGLREPVPACEVAWEPLAASGTIPLPPKLAPAPALGLFGRASEQATIARCWEAAKRGNVQLLLIGGEPGIGKTRLATEAARAAHVEGAAVMFGSCDEHITLPYRPFVEALRHYVAHAPDEVLAAHVKEHNGELTRLVPGLANRIPNLPKPQSAEAETGRYLMFEAVTGILAAASQRHPVLLILDDVQWAGAPDLLLLKHIVRSATPMNVMIIATYRDAELSRTHPLTTLLADLRRETSVERIALRGLDDEGVLALVTAATGRELDTDLIALAHAIHRETEGSPLFVGEILRNLTESGAGGERWTYRNLASIGIPQGVREAIGRRLSRLSEQTNKVLRLASVIGREFDLALLAKIAELSEDAIMDAIDEAKGAALVAETAGETDHYTFTHGLIRATLYDELSASRRARMHRRVGEALEALALAKPDERIDELAYHWLSATKVSDAARAIGYAQRAAEKAMSKLAFEEAAKYYEQALSALEPHDHEGELLRCDLLIALSDAQRRAGSGNYREAVGKAAGYARKLGDAHRLALAALGNARLGGGYANAILVDQKLIALYEEALKALGDSDSELRARLLANLSGELVLTEFRERRHELSCQAVEIARRLGDQAVLFHALNARAFAINDPMTLADRLVLTAEMETLASDLGIAEMHWLAAFHRAGALLESGDMEAGERMVARMHELGTELRQPYFAWVASYARTMLSITRGAVADVEHQVFADFQIGTAAGQPDAGNVFGAQLAALRWDQSGSAELTETVRAAAEAQPHAPGYRAILAHLYCETDRLEEARKELQVFAATGFAIRLNWISAIELVNLADVCADLNDRNAAELLYPLLKPVAGQVGMVGNVALCYGSLAYPCGVLAACLEHWEEAERYFEQALAMNRKIGARPWDVRTRRAYARMLLDRKRPGDSARAAEQITAAMAEAEPLGMVREVILLNRLRERPR